MSTKPPIKKRILVVLLSPFILTVIIFASLLLAIEKFFEVFIDGLNVLLLEQFNFDINRDEK